MDVLQEVVWPPARPQPAAGRLITVKEDFESYGGNWNGGGKKLKKGERYKTLIMGSERGHSGDAVIKHPTFGEQVIRDYHFRRLEVSAIQQGAIATVQEDSIMVGEQFKKGQQGTVINVYDTGDFGIKFGWIKVGDGERTFKSIHLEQFTFA